LEITSAYAPFANGGYRAEPFLISKIAGSDGKILYQRKSGQAKKVIGSRELTMMNAMLRTALETGTGKNARLKNWPAAGKTGTSQNSRDGWFIGYTANLTTGIWFGNDDGSPTAKLVGGGIPARTWANYMEFAHANVTVANLPGVNSLHAAPIPKVRPLFSLSKNKTKDRSRNINRDLDTRNNERQIVDGSDANPQTTGAIRPSKGLGRSTKQHRTILDLLFGD
jgi:penicillin-binding protein 1A